jgi:hypothetical protein
VIYLEPLYSDTRRFAEIPIDEVMVVAAISQGDLDFSDERSKDGRSANKTLTEKINDTVSQKLSPRSTQRSRS